MRAVKDELCKHLLVWVGQKNPRALETESLGLQKVRDNGFREASGILGFSDVVSMHFGRLMHQTERG